MGERKCYGARFLDSKYYTRYNTDFQLYSNVPYDVESEYDGIIPYQHLVLVLVAAKDVSFDESGKNVACANELLLLQL